jgi:hypothetical protein
MIIVYIIVGSKSSMVAEVFLEVMEMWGVLQIIGSQNQNKRAGN